MDFDPASLTDEERARHQIRRLPATLKEALSELERDQVLADALGREYFKTFLTVKASECAEFAAQDIDFELHHHRFKF